MKFITAVAVGIVFCKAAFCASDAIRDLPAFYVPGHTFEVTLSINIDPQNPPNGIILRESMPDWWTIFFDLQGNPVWSIEPAQNAVFNGVNKWVLFLPVSGTLTYTVSVPPDASGIYTFSGTTYTTTDGTLPITGDTTISDAVVQQGDINGDGTVDISDVILCLRMAVGLEITINGKEYNDPYGEPFKGAADMNGDKDVDISDVILVLRKTIGL